MTTLQVGLMCVWAFTPFSSHLWQRCFCTGIVSPRSVCSEPHTHNDPHQTAVWTGWWSPGPSCWRAPGKRAGCQERWRRGAHYCSPAPGACPGRPAGPEGRDGTTAAARTCNCQHCSTGTLSPAPGDFSKAGRPHWTPRGWLWRYREGQMGQLGDLTTDLMQ